MVSVIINYSSNEKIFIDVILVQCTWFSDDIVVSYGSHLYDGTPEDQSHISGLRAQYPDVEFVEYRVDTSLNLKHQRGVVDRPVAYWHNLARWTAIERLEKKNSWVFVIDADEIPDGPEVRRWLMSDSFYKNENYCYKMACNWFFKLPTNRAKTLEDSVLLIHRKHLTERNIFHDYERDSLIITSGCYLMRQTTGLDGKVLFDHYSWVRNRKGLEHKIRSWGHSNEYHDPEKIIEFIYRNDDVNDIIHGYQYDKVENKYNIRL